MRESITRPAFIIKDHSLWSDTAPEVVNGP